MQLIRAGLTLGAIASDANVRLTMVAVLTLAIISERQAKAVAESSCERNVRYDPLFGRPLHRGRMLTGE